MFKGEHILLVEHFFHTLISYMILNMKTIYSIGEDQKTLITERSIAAPLEKVWQAWTTDSKLEKWWAPLPY